MIQKAYSKTTLTKLAGGGMKDTLRSLADRFDAEVSRILLRFTKRYIAKLGPSGAEAIRARLRILDDSSEDTKLYNATDNKYKKEKGDAAYRKSGESRAAAVKKAFPGAQHQPCSTILEMMLYSSEDEQTFKAAVMKLGELTGAEVKLSDRKGTSLKGFLRLYEKALLKAVILGLDDVDFSMIYDVLRAMLVAPDTGVASKCQTAVYEGTELSPCRSKCRLVGESVTGWRDELINVKHVTGKYGLIGEIQIVRSKMLVQRETMGGHDGYDESRSLRGLLDACVASGHSAKELTKKEEKALAKALAKRKKAIVKWEAKWKKARASHKVTVAKIDLQIEAITGSKPDEVTFAEL
jgi:hypothetical protein